VADDRTVAISCPQCGSPFTFREGDRCARCPSCRCSLAVSGAAGIARFGIPERVDLGMARSAARKFLATAGVADRVVDSLRFEQGELCFLPFWRLRGYLAGWSWQERETVVTEEVYDANGLKQKREVRGPNERTQENLLVPVDYSTAACDTSRFGLAGIATAAAVLPLTGMNFEALSQRGTLFDPVKEPELVRREAVATVRGRMGGNHVLRSANRVTLCGERLDLISYPVWNLTFSRGDRLYPLVIDGVNGRVLKGRFPGRLRIRLLEPMLTVALLVFAFSLHVAGGVLAVAGFLAWLAANGGLSAGRLLAWFFQLVERGEEVEVG